MPVDLELVLAIDSSGSINAREFALQMEGIARAVTDPDVIAAIERGPLGQIAVAFIIWAEAGIPGDESRWFRIASQSDAARLAATIRTFPRRVGGGTGIGAGLVQAMRMFERNGFEGTRQVVDVSGDGRETPPRDYVVLVDSARGMALSRRITLNGLAIENEDADLADWYRAEVATGRGAFVMAVADFEDFADAMRRKLIREIEYQPPIGWLGPDLKRSARDGEAN